MVQTSNVSLTVKIAKLPLNALYLFSCSIETTIQNNALPYSLKVQIKTIIEKKARQTLNSKAQIEANRLTNKIIEEITEMRND